MALPSYTTRAIEARRTAERERQWAADERRRADGAEHWVAALHLSVARLHDDAAKTHDRLAVRLEVQDERERWYPSI